MVEEGMEFQVCLELTSLVRGDRGDERGLPPLGEDFSAVDFPQEQELSVCREGTQAKSVSV